MPVYKIPPTTKIKIIMPIEKNLLLKRLSRKKVMMAPLNHKTNNETPYTPKIGAKAPTMVVVCE